METPLPGMGEMKTQEVGDIDVFDGDNGLHGSEEEEIAAMRANASPEANRFMDSLGKIMKELSEPCQKEFGHILETQGKMVQLSEACQVEVSTASAAVPDIVRHKEAAVQEAADRVRRANGRQPDPNTGKHLAVMLFILFVCIVGYIVWVNRKLKEAGLTGKRPKHLSKKKMEKEMMRKQQAKKIM
ncbi:hypothetical protein Naga_100022g20 [Nannochloropsis gaditana]|uniref:Uncharacterized protein n=1 Tax=Nannochloropsis gaditana TaxID=72520 RepID=W7U9Y6_9STRA|nr:hypothetical protein Naga_100022g20 [Nannochloropsis gaditana]